MKFSKEQNLFTLNIIGLALCALAHTLPSGFNFLAALIGLLLICCYLVESYKLKKNAKEQQATETEKE